jgi:predicted small secreted protein
MKKIIAIAAALAFLAGCNTIAGAGKDVQKVGSAVTGAASR